MKTKNLFLTIVLLFIATLNYAQTSAETSGIAIQGIARDANNTARINTDIILTFELYYLDGGNNPIPIGGAVDEPLTTDNFGVFSHVLQPGVANNAIIANQQAYLKISDGTTTISDEKLNHVPYAIAANNGVPTGSIMPFVGEVAPAGWVLCNNTPLAGIVGSENLMALVGDRTPDLRGLFLRGAGQNGFSTVETELNETQGDKFKNHGHGNNFSATNQNSAHKHNTTFVRDKEGATGDDGSVFMLIDADSNNDGTTDIDTDNDGSHTHEISGSVFESTTGLLEETRSANYGVTYIIKL